MNKPNFLTGCFLAIVIYGSGQSHAGTNLSNAYKDKDGQLAANNFFVQVQGGALFPLSHKQLFVNNGSGFPPPDDVDAYTTKSPTQGTMALIVGKRIAIPSSWITHYTVSGRIQSMFPANVGHAIMQYRLPEFLNYHYHWKLSALALTADTKLNLVHFSQFSPYINGGLGVSFNQARSYHETALPGVTARFSPAYGNHVLTQFAYHLGAGVDFSCTANWLFSAGYEFTSFGNFSSGAGQSTWSTQALRLGPYEANTVLLGVTYLIH